MSAISSPSMVIHQIVNISVRQTCDVTSLYLLTNFLLKWSLDQFLSLYEKLSVSRNDTAEMFRTGSSALKLFLKKRSKLGFCMETSHVVLGSVVRCYLCFVLYTYSPSSALKPLDCGYHVFRTHHRLILFPLILFNKQEGAASNIVYL